MNFKIPGFMQWRSSGDHRAMVIIVLAQLFSKLGDALSSAKTTLPWLLQSVGVPTYFAGMLVPIRESVSMIPQVLFSRIIEQVPMYKRTWCIASLLQGVCVISFGVVALTLEGRSAGWAVIGILVIFSLARCIASITSKLTLAKTVSKQARGRTTGYSASAAGAISAAFGVSLFAGWLSTSDSGTDFSVLAALLFLAGACWFVAAVVFLLLKEADSTAVSGNSRERSLVLYFKPLAGDAVFIRFLCARAFFLASALSAPYYILLANTSDASFQSLGLFILMSGAAGLSTGVLWGRLADKSSKRVMQLAAIGASAISISIYVLHEVRYTLLSSVWFLPICYFVLESCHQGIRVGRKTYVINASSPARRTSYVTASNTVIGLLLLVLGGAITMSANVLPHEMIGLFSIVGLVGVFIAHWLPEVEDSGP